MSQVSSDFNEDPFADADVIEADDAGMMMAEEEAPAMAPPPPQYRKQSFSIYSIMLILSFVFLLVAAILFFVEADALRN